MGTASKYLESSIEEFKSKYLQYPMRKNRYVCRFGFKNQELNKYFNDNNMGIYVNSVTTPNPNYGNVSSLQGGGHPLSIVNEYTPNSMQIQLIVTQKVWEGILKWKRMIYDEKTFTYGYIEDYGADLYIHQYDVNDNFIMTHMFTLCYLDNVGPLVYSYDEQTDLLECDLTLLYYRYEYTIETNEKTNSADRKDETSTTDTKVTPKITTKDTTKQKETSNTSNIPNTTPVTNSSEHNGNGRPF